jgi:hypothetical protein
VERLIAIQRQNHRSAISWFFQGKSRAFHNFPIAPEQPGAVAPGEATRVTLERRTTNGTAHDLTITDVHRCNRLHKDVGGAPDELALDFITYSGNFLEEA